MKKKKKLNPVVISAMVSKDESKDMIAAFMARVETPSFVESKAAKVLNHSGPSTQHRWV